MEITSSAFADGATIPKRYTGAGENRSPPLAWTGVPAGTRSLALVCEDPDAPNGTWYHWAVFDIPPGESGLHEGFPRTADAPIRQAINDSKKLGYDGPYPPRGHGPHRYRFHLMALSVDRLPLPAKAGCRDVERAARDHMLGEAVLTGIYERPG